MNRILQARFLILLLGVALFGAACGVSEQTVPVGSSTAATSEPSPATAAADPTPTTTVEVDPPKVTPEPTPEPRQDTSAQINLTHAAEQKWLASSIEDYRYTFQRSCECDDETSAPRTVTVRNGRVAEVTVDGTPSSLEGFIAEDFFAMALGALADGLLVEMTYDDRGFPSSGIIDVEATWVDGGFIYSTRDFESLIPGPVAPADPLYAVAVEQWRAAGIDSYVMTYVRTCFCPRIDFTVTVVDGRLVDVRHKSEIDIDIDLGDALTIDDMFEIIRIAQNGGAHQIVSEYHPTEGRPVSIYIDQDEMIDDEEFGYEVISFEPGRVLIEPELELPSWLETICVSLERFESIDDKPTTAAEGRAVVEEMVTLAQVVLAAAPAEHSEGAVELLRFIEGVRDLAEAADWEPEFFDSLSDTEFAELGVNLELIEEFLDGFSDRCSS